MKRWFSLAAVVLLSLALVIGVACGGGEEEEEGVTELKYGIGTPLTGAYGAAIGLPGKYAFNMAAEKIGEFTVAGEQYRWKLILEDNLASVAGGLASAQKFIYEHDVDFMHQTFKDPAMGALPICEELGMLLGVSGADYSDFGPDKPHFFQTSATLSLHAPAFFDWLTKEHHEVKRVAFTAPDSLTGYVVGAAVVASAEHFGLEVVAEEYTPTAMLELMPIANKIMGRDPDLYVGGADIYDMMVAMGYEGLAASYFWTEADPEKVGWDVCEGYLLFVPHPVGDVWPEVPALREEYEDRYGIEFGLSAFGSFNLLYVMTDVLRQAGTVDDIDRIREIMETGAFDSLAGPIAYGLEELNGVGHVGLYPTPIVKVVGEKEYQLLAMYTPEETEAIMVEVFGE